LNYKDVLFLIFIVTFIFMVVDNMGVYYCTNPVTLKSSMGSPLWFWLLMIEVIITLVFIIVNEGPAVAKK